MESKLCENCGKMIPDSNHDNMCQMLINKKCIICEKQFKKLKYLNQHIKLHFPENLYQCSFCIKILKTKENLIRHYDNMHKTKNNIWKCTICNAIFNQKYNLNKHKKIHSKYNHFENDK